MAYGIKQSQKTELNFWVMPNAGFATRSILQTYIDEFEKTHPDVKIHLTIHPWSLSWSGLMDAIKGRYVGPRPDILQVGTTQVATLSYLGALDRIPDSSVLPEEDRMSSYIWDPGSQYGEDQELYCVPWFIDVRVLYYRRDIFEQLSLSPNLLNDWKGFHQACLEIQKAIRRHGPVSRIIAPLGIPGQKPGVLMHDLAPWIWGAGGDFCSQDLQKAEFNSEGAMQGAQFYFDLINNGMMPIRGDGVTSGNFFTGETAMQFSGSWPGATYLNSHWCSSVVDVAAGFAVAPLPSGPEGRYTFLGGSNLAVASMSEKKELAWNFIKFMSNPDIQLSHASAIGALTARLTSLDDLFKAHPDAKKVFLDSFSHARRLPRLIELGSVEQIISKWGNKMLSLIRSGQHSHKQLGKEMSQSNQAIQTVLSLHRYGRKSEEVAA